ncbi:hypothetical protein [Roseateles chitinivorans]|uniref:hypothetical protein n=1 Tax=Roseateles chitinivorans TaxID=2917965 RepID=UPI00117EDB0C|nr:hypothetical protein [Roseateles chitinivorans]
MKASYLLSGKFSFSEHAPFALAVMLVITGGEGYFRPGDVMRHMTQLIQEGVPFDSQQYTEIGQWRNRASDVISPTPVEDDAYYAWADPGFWSYFSPLGIYTKSDFITLFEDCCRNFVVEHPERRDEFYEALSANGMSLIPTAERP